MIPNIPNKRRIKTTLLGVLTERTGALLQALYKFADVPLPMVVFSSSTQS